MPIVPTEILKTLPGRPIFEKVWGSHSHNTDLPTSDQDYLVIYQASTAGILSLDPPPETIQTKGPDVEAHELGKFCRLLLKGNPSMVECLFTDRMCEVWDDRWDDLVRQRQRFLSKRVVEQYLGYGQGQLRRFQGGNRLHTKGGQANEKWLYHMTRVLLDGLAIARGEEPIVWKEGDNRELLMQIREGRQHPDVTISVARLLIDDIEKAQPWPLPDEGDREWLNRWLLTLRMPIPAMPSYTLLGAIDHQ